MEALLAAILKELPGLSADIPSIVADVEALIASFKSAKTPAQQVSALASLAAVVANAHANAA